MLLVGSQYVLTALIPLIFIFSTLNLSILLGAECKERVQGLFVVHDASPNKKNKEKISYNNLHT